MLSLDLSLLTYLAPPPQDVLSPHKETQVSTLTCYCTSTPEATKASKTHKVLLRIFLFALVAEVAHDVQFNSTMQAKSVYIPIGSQRFAAETRHSNLHKVQQLSTFFGRSGHSSLAAGSVGVFGRSCP